jgi:hypothetical protein
VPSTIVMTSRFLIPVHPCRATRSALPAGRRLLQEQVKSYPSGQRNATDNHGPQPSAPEGHFALCSAPSPGTNRQYPI